MRGEQNFPTLMAKVVERKIKRTTSSNLMTRETEKSLVEMGKVSVEIPL